MDSKKAGFTSIDEYIAAFPKETQKILKEIRAATMPRVTLRYAIEHFEAKQKTYYMNLRKI